MTTGGATGVADLHRFRAFIIFKYAKEPTKSAIVEWSIALDFGLFVATFVLDFTEVKPKNTYQAPTGRE